MTIAPGPYPQPPQYAPHAYARPRNGLGNAAVILGVFAIVSVAIPPIAVLLGIPAGIVGIILGALGVQRVKRMEATNKGASITGIVLSAVGAALIGGTALLTLGAYLATA